MRIVFNKVSIGRATRRWRENGKRRQETKEFYQTVSMFNKNADGTLKEPSEMRTELYAQRAAWLEEKK